MVDRYNILTVNHKVLDTEDLGHFILRYSDQDELVKKLEMLKAAFGQEEILYLSTCNRVIFFMYGPGQLDKTTARAFFKKVNHQLKDDQISHLSNIIEHYNGLKAIQHLYEVAASIDSLVVGEREIFRQYREAYTFALKNDLSGDNLRIANLSIVKAGKDVYTNTAIGAKPVSVVSLAIQEFLKRALPIESRILLLGSSYHIQSLT